MSARHMSEETTANKGTTRKGRRAYLNDYELQDDGSYEYTGVMHEWASEAERTSFWFRARLLIGLAIFCVMIAGCVPAPGTAGTFYVLIPFGVALIGIAFSLAALVRIIREGSSMRDHVYEKSVPMLPLKLAIGMTGAFSSGMGELAHLLVVRPATGIGMGIAYVALMVIAGVCLLLLLRECMPLVRGETWVKTR